MWETLRPSALSLGARRGDDGETTIDVSRLFDDALISAFRISGVDDYQVLSGVRYATCIE